MDSDSDSEIDGIVPGTPVEIATGLKFEKFERERAILYFEHNAKQPNVETVRKYLAVDRYMRGRVDQCLAKYTSPKCRLRYFRTQVAQWYASRKTSVVRKILV